MGQNGTIKSTLLKILADAAPTVISERIIADDLAAARLVQIPAPELDLRRAMHMIWEGAAGGGQPRR